MKIIKKNKKFTRRLMPVKNTTRKINNKKSKNIKSYKHNKYETSKIIKNFYNSFIKKRVISSVYIKK